jgi:hypothetical protein
MNVRRSLESRIRGWLPKEPIMISMRLQVNQEKGRPPLTIPSEYKLSATKSWGAFAVFWAILYGFLFSYFLNFKWYPTSAIQVVAWIIAGSAIGVITCAIFTKNQLRQLLMDYQFFPDGKDLVLFFIPQLLFFIFGIFVSFLFASSMSVSGLQGLLISVCTLEISLALTRFILLVGFEKKENMRLMQSYWGPGIYLIPKAPEQC